MFTESTEFADFLIIIIAKFRQVLEEICELVILIIYFRQDFHDLFPEFRKVLDIISLKASNVPELAGNSEK